jgi:drug/metabolite transporter (DMT)-like permease
MSRLLSGRAAPILVLAGGACAIAFAPIFVRLTGTGPAAAGFWRLSFALPALAAIAFAQPRSREAGALRPRPAALLAGLFFALDLGFWHYGIKLTTVANATILSNLAPVGVTIGAWLLLGERPGWRFLVGLALALAGSWAIAAARGGGAGVDPTLGDALSVSTAVWYAAYMLCVRKARFAQGASQVMLWSSAAGAPLLLAAAVALNETIAPMTPAGWAACLGLGAVHVTGQGAIAWALGRLPAATASVILLVQPVVASVMGWLIFAEPMSPLQILGGLVALAGVVLAQIASARPAAEGAS